MKRRLMIAKALSHEPKILFLDEPTAGVDVHLRREMWSLVRELRASGVTIILTTHYIEEAQEMADRIGVINKGEIVMVEEKERLMKKLGRKTLSLKLRNPLQALPERLQNANVQMSPGGAEIQFSYQTGTDENDVGSFLQMIFQCGLDVVDLQTKESNLEEIFLNLLRGTP